MSFLPIVQDTIVAQATPSGYGGVSIVRSSGSLVPEIIKAILKLSSLPPRYATLLSFYSLDQYCIDKGLALFFPLPHSLTGEDIVELHCHGGPMVVDLLLEHILFVGARLARPGEFLERAFLNRKIDLTQAEAIADLIQAHSKDAAKLAMRSLQGEFSNALHQLIEQMIELRMKLEAMLNFSDDADEMTPEQAIYYLKIMMTQLQIIQQKAKDGSILREGTRVVIVGEPNVGKSSLLNCFSEKERAIVTDIAGTTRDILHEEISMDGMRIHLIDTAGLRDSQDIIEKEGIRRAHAEIEKADLVLYMIDAKQSLSTIERCVSEWVSKTNAKLIIIRNKIDLSDEQASVECQAEGALAAYLIVSLSVKEKNGIDLLKQSIKQHMYSMNSIEGLFLARRRHLEALKKANDHLFAALNYIEDMHQVDELLAEELLQAQNKLNEITGAFTSDDLLGRIFSTFCIGK